MSQEIRNMIEQVASEIAARQVEAVVGKLTLDTGERKLNLKKVDNEVVNTGTQIILPEKMTKPEAVEVLKRKIQQDEEVVNIREEIVGFPFDAAYALMTVAKMKFGWTNAETIMTIMGPKRATMMNVEIAPGKFVQVPWGPFSIPGVEGVLETGVGKTDAGQLCFMLVGKAKQRFKAQIAELAQAVRDYLKTHSLYKGKAIRLRTDNEGEIQMTTAPGFLDLSRVNEDELTFSDDVRAHVETSLFTPIEHTEACRKYGIPLKRGVLLEGPYGTGKTLTAYVTAKKCEANGWTFIYLDRVTGIKEAFSLARQYAPSVIFAEDIDRTMTGGRTVKVDDVLNNIDGIESKGSEIITILTTNHVDQIEKAMLRPGRLDAVISVDPPDAKAAERLMRIYARGLIAVNEDITGAGKELAGQIPAVIREVVERAKLYAIHRAGEIDQLKGDDLETSAKGMKRHLALMAPPKPEKLDSLTEAMANVVQTAAQEAVNAKFPNGVAKKIDEIHNATV